MDFKRAGIRFWEIRKSVVNQIVNIRRQKKSWCVYLVIVVGLPHLRGVPTERRKLCDCRYQFIKRVYRSVGTHILCDFCYFRCKKRTKITLDGLRPSSNMLNISLAVGMFSY